ncbi:MAG TPA: S41 family peptidase [Myxococcota bacterium]|nr:S41 family peptidase [Myxococcota bacterium]
MKYNILAVSTIFCFSIFAADPDQDEYKNKREYELIEPSDEITGEDDGAIYGKARGGQEWVIAKGYASPDKKISTTRPAIWEIFQHSGASVDLRSDADKFAKNLEIFDWVSQQLKSKFENSKIKIYKKAYDKWKEKEYRLRSQVSSDTTKMEGMLSAELGNLGVSHFGFERVRPVHFGVATVPAGPGEERVVKVYPNSPAAKAGFKPTDVLVTFADKPVTFDIIRDAYFSKKCTVKVTYHPSGNPNKLLSKNVRIETSIYYQPTLGMTFRAGHNESVVVTKVVINGRSFKAGIREGSKIIGVVGIGGVKQEHVGSILRTLELRAGEKIDLQVIQPSGEHKTLSVEVDYLGESLFPSWYELLPEDDMKIVYLKIPTFGEFYDPHRVHVAMSRAQNANLLIIDLRDNGGGNGLHLLSYLLAPGSVYRKSIHGDGEPPIPSSVPRRELGDDNNSISCLNCWYDKVTDEAFDFTGKIAFIVNENSCSASELGPAVLLERQSYASQGFIDCKLQLYPRVVLIGKTEGLCQNGGSDIFSSGDTVLGDFYLHTPSSEVATPIRGNKIEGIGIEGIPINSQRPTADDDRDSAIEQAIEWARQQTKS